MRGPPSRGGAATRGPGPPSALVHDLADHETASPTRDHDPARQARHPIGAVLPARGCRKVSARGPRPRSSACRSQRVPWGAICIGDADAAVFGEGPSQAPIVLVGEQPGDQEDRRGSRLSARRAGCSTRPSTRRASSAATYVTNAVKHFKWSARQAAHPQEAGTCGVVACRPWLARRSRRCSRGIVCLGATAAQSLLGPSFRITQHRGEVLYLDGRALVATTHPSAILRAPDDEREAAFAGLVNDLSAAARGL